MTDSTITVWRLRPNGRGDFVRVDLWACDELMTSGLNVGFIGDYQKQPYPWAGHDQSDPAAPISRSVQRLHTWIWDRAITLTLGMLMAPLLVAMRLRDQRMLALVVRHVVLVDACQRRKETVIHHVNEREADNRLSNLRMLGMRQHNRHHAQERKQKARTRKLNKYVTTGSGWWQDMPVIPAKRLSLYQVRLVSRRTGDIAFVRPLPDGSLCEHQSEAGRFLEEDAGKLLKEYREAMPMWECSMVPIDIPRSIS